VIRPRVPPAAARLAPVVTMLLAGSLLVGLPAGIADAGPAGGGTADAPVRVAAAVAQADPGFGDAGNVADRYGIPVWDYRVDGLRARGPDVGQVATTAPLGASAFVFQFVKFLVVAIVWLLRFALDFGVADTLLTPVEELIDVYQGFVGALGLVPLALMLCVFWFGLAALRGRVGRGAGEITLSFVLVVVLGAVLAAPGPMLLSDQGLLGRAKEVGATVAVLAVQDPTVAMRAPACRQVVPGDEPLVDGCLPDELGEAVPARHDPHVLRWILQTWLVDLYIRQPHQYIVYGQRLDCPLSLNVRRSGPDAPPGPEPCRPHPCVGRYNEILRTTPAEAATRTGHWNADPNSYMYDMMHPTAGGYDLADGCPPEQALALAGYNNSGDWGRLAVTVVLLLALVVLFVFVALGVLLPLIVGQVLVAVLAVALVFVLPVALLGGGGRRVLWQWFGLLLSALFMIIVALVGLSLMLIITDLLLRANWHLYLSLLMVCVSSLVFLWLQRRLLRGGMVGGAAAVGRIRGGVAAGTVAVGGGPPDQGWSRAATAGLDAGNRWVARQATFATVREDLDEQRRLRRTMRNQDLVRDVHPDLARREQWRLLEAQQLWSAGAGQVDRWQRRRARLRAGSPWGTG
jgi:hypothetical protein